MNRDSSSPGRRQPSRLPQAGVLGRHRPDPGAGGATLLTGCSGDPGPASGYQHLRERDLELLRR